MTAAICDSEDAKAFVDDFNRSYEEKHAAFEDQV
jgi:hypothetical protein